MYIHEYIHCTCGMETMYVYTRVYTLYMYNIPLVGPVYGVSQYPGLWGRANNKLTLVENN